LLVCWASSSCSWNCSWKWIR